MGQGLQTYDFHQFLLFTWLAQPRLVFLGHSRESNTGSESICCSSLLGSQGDIVYFSIFLLAFTVSSGNIRKLWVYYAVY